MFIFCDKLSIFQIFSQLIFEMLDYFMPQISRTPGLFHDSSKKWISKMCFIISSIDSVNVWLFYFKWTKLMLFFWKDCWNNYISSQLVSGICDFIYFFFFCNLLHKYAITSSQITKINFFFLFCNLLIKCCIFLLLISEI